MKPAGSRTFTNSRFSYFFRSFICFYETTTSGSGPINWFYQCIHAWGLTFVRFKINGSSPVCALNRMASYVAANAHVSIEARGSVNVSSPSANRHQKHYRIEPRKSAPSRCIIHKPPPLVVVVDWLGDNWLTRGVATFISQRTAALTSV